MKRGDFFFFLTTAFVLINAVVTPRRLTLQFAINFLSMRVSLRFLNLLQISVKVFLRWGSGLPSAAMAVELAQAERHNKLIRLDRAGI